MSPPALPPVQSDATLAIFIHPSLQTVSAPNERFGDSERLAFIGERVLQMAVAEIAFEKRPMLSGVELESEQTVNLSDESYDQWVTHYKLRDKVACTADQREELRDPRETRHLFNAYAGAVFVEQGYATVKTWIHPLVDPDYQSTSSTSATRAINFTGSGTNTDTGNPPPPASPPPPLPGATSTTGAFLALFNQTAMQRAAKLEWPAVASGEAHQLTWSVDCVVNGVLKGRGAGRSKQQAKEEAARKAFQAMGWANGASGPYR